ncbi:MAG: YidC/Oxa1 family membrane protein insertase [Acidimicrobiales bacterium]|nr:YidC/Oxa1 family membrane protein insertase [Acidimicrobiales bacterium]
MFDLLATLLSWFYDFWPSYGMSITLLTVLIMVILTPLTLKQTRSMIKIQHVQPELKKIQNKYKNDKERMNKEVMAFYQANNVNPLSGCLPLFVQAPVFLVLYNVINGLTRRLSNLGEHTGWVMGIFNQDVSVPPEQARVFYPDYIDHQSSLFQDLSKENEMVSWGVDLARSASDALSESFVVSIPYFILILLVFATSWYQQKQIRGRNQQAAISPQQQMIFKVMPFFLPVISFSFDAALVVYFVISNLYRIAQQGYITRKFYGENATKKETVVVSSTAEKDPENNNDKTGKSTKKLDKPATKPSSSSEAKRKRTTAGSNENHSHLHKEKPSKIEKKEKKTKEIKKEKNVKNSPIEENRMQTGRVTPSGTNIPRSQKKRKKKKRK